MTESSTCLKCQAYEQQLAEARVVIQGYLEELERVAKLSAELLGHLTDRQAEGDRLRARLRKLTNVYETTEALLLAVQTQDPKLQEYQLAYNKAKLMLGSPDE